MALSDAGSGANGQPSRKLEQENPDRCIRQVFQTGMAVRGPNAPRPYRSSRTSATCLSTRIHRDLPILSLARAVGISVAATTPAPPFLGNNKLILRQLTEIDPPRVDFT